MSEQDLERLLHERAQRLDGERALSAGAEAKVYAELKRDAESELGRPSHLRLVMGTLLLAAAAVTLLVLSPWNTIDYGRSECQLALLDGAGRPLESVARSTDRDDFRRPDVVLVEYVATDDAYVRMAIIDALGFLRVLEVGPGADQRIAVGQDGIVSLELGDFETRGAGDSLVSILLFSSRELIPVAELADRLPDQFEHESGSDRDRELAALVRSLEAELGCTVQVESFTLERRSP